MKITLVETNARGGLVHFSYQLCEALSETGAEMTMITGRDYELAELPHLTRVEPILQLWPLFEDVATSPTRRRLRRAFRPFRRGWRALVAVREWARLTLHLLRRRPDVAIFTLPPFPFVFIFLRILKAAGIPVVEVCHEFERREAHWRGSEGLRTRLSRLIHGSCRVILFFSESTRRDFVASLGAVAPTYALPHGPQMIFDSDPTLPDRLRDRHGVAKGQRVVLFFGGIRPSKGVPDLVDAFALLDDGLDARLVIAGYPSREFDTKGLQAQVRRLGLTDRVTLALGYVPNEEVGALVEMSDIVAFPYRSATASGAVALAQSLGRPVIATAIGGLAEAVEDNVTGRLVPPRDATALAAAITELLSNPTESARLASNARDQVTQSRSWGVIAREIRQIFQQEGLET